jgi:hypothetical protein
MTATESVARVAIRVRELIAAGVPARVALDEVCGAGTFDRLASDLYDTLRAGK